MYALLHLFPVLCIFSKIFLLYFVKISLLAHVLLQPGLRTSNHSSAHGSSQRPHEAHASIAQDCLIYLLQLEDSQDMDRTHDDDSFSGQWRLLFDRFLKDLPASLPLISYAARYWAHHARLAGEKPEQLFQLMVEAFEPHTFEAWIHVNTPWRKRLSSRRLEYATKCRLPRLVRHLLDQDIDVNLPGAQRRTPLQTAAMVGDLELVKLLLNYGAKVNVPTRRCDSALWYAAERGFVEIVELLVEEGADIENRRFVEHFRVFLVAAAERERYASTMAHNFTGNDSVGNEPARLAEQLVANGCIEALAADPKDALKAAVVQGDDFKCLLGANFDVDAFRLQVERYFELWTCTNRPNPLQAAAQKGHLSILRLLIDRGADVNHRGYSLKSGPALYQASAAGHLEAVQLLLRSGADPNTRSDWHKTTALQATLKKGHGLVAQLLLTSGAAKDVGDGLQSRLEDVQKGITTFQTMSPYNLLAPYSRDNRRVVH